MALDLSLIIPCYNEATYLRESVATLLRSLDESRLDYEVVFVEDCSQDETGQVLDEICSGLDRCRVIHHEYNRGRGGAFKTGVAATSGPVVGFIDIDLEIHSLYIPSLVSSIQHDGYDVATAQRFYLFRQTRALHRHILSQGYRFICQIALGFGIKDSETGCKFFRRETAGDVVLACENNGWFWDTEVMARSVLANLRIIEMPVLFLRQRDRPSSVQVFRDSWQYLLDIHRFRVAVGLSLSRKSMVYWTGTGYDLIMKTLYGRSHAQSYAEVARRIPDGASVVDVCAGTCRIHLDSLRDRGCSYLGLDFNAHVVMSARRRGVDARHFDLLHGDIPEADYILMCSSLYHFRNLEGEILDKLIEAARVAVIVSEPVQNLSSSGPGAWSRWLRERTNPGVGEFGYRYDLASFRALAERHGSSEFCFEDGWRNAVAIFAKQG